MPDVRLLLITPDMPRALDDADAFARAHTIDLGEQTSLLRDIVAQFESHRERTGAPIEWGGHIVVDADASRVVGTCGYVAAPDVDGRVEIAYFTFPAFERQGYGAAMAAALIARAARTGAVRTVIAHTLPEPNASTRILQRLGFARDGTAVDHEAGTVWRWARAITSADA